MNLNLEKTINTLYEQLINESSFGEKALYVSFLLNNGNTLYSFIFWKETNEEFKQCFFCEDGDKNNFTFQCDAEYTYIGQYVIKKINVFLNETKKLETDISIYKIRVIPVTRDSFSDGFWKKRHYVYRRKEEKFIMI